MSNITSHNYNNFKQLKNIDSKNIREEKYKIDDFHGSIMLNNESLKK